MRFPGGSKYSHCSVSLEDKQLIVIGGYGDGSPTSEVLSFDVENMSPGPGGWTALPSMNTARQSHACATGNYEGRYGIFVTGGWDGGQALSSVEFYVAREHRWTAVGSMTTARHYHSLAMVAGMPYAAGGWYHAASVERLNGTTWEEAGSLRIPI